MYIVVHTGSRNLGKQVAEIYQKLAVKNMSGWDRLMDQQARMIEEYKAAGRRSELQEAIRQLRCAGSKVSPGKTICTTCACVRNGPGSTAASS